MDDGLMDMPVEHVEPGTEGLPMEFPAQINILLVDDDPLSRHIVSTLLVKCSYKVTCVSSAQEAISVLESTEADCFQLILTDVVMPCGGDGLDLLEHVQGHKQWRHIPVVMMSANDRVGTVRECLQRGASHYILKPVTRKEVQNIWQHAYRNRPSHPHNASLSTVPSLMDPQPPHAPSSPSAPSNTPQGVHTKPLAPSPHVKPGARLTSGEETPLTAFLDSQPLSWPTRLHIFTQLLHSTLQACSTNPLHHTQPFSNPAWVQVSRSHAISFCDPAPHAPSNPIYLSVYYRAPPDTSAAPPAESHQYVYALGVLLFELALAPAATRTRSERLAALPSLPTDLLTSRPAVAVLVLRMIASKADERPSLIELTQEPVLRAAYEKLLTSRDMSLHTCACLDSAVQYDFLDRVEAAQQQRALEIQAAMAQVDVDLSAVEAALAGLPLSEPQSVPPGNPHMSSCSSLPNPSRSSCPSLSHRSCPSGSASNESLPRVNVSSSPCPSQHPYTTCSTREGTPDAAPTGLGAMPKRCVDAQSPSGHLKRHRFGSPSQIPVACKAICTSNKGIHLASVQREGQALVSSRDVTSEASTKVRRRWERLTPHVPNLLTAYNELRLSCHSSAQREAGAESELPGGQAAQLDAARGVRAGGLKGNAAAVPQHLQLFAGNMHAASRYERFDLSAVLQHNPGATVALQGRKMVCSLALDRSDEFLATVGVNKAIRIYRFADLTDEDIEASQPRYPVLNITSRSKLSCCCFNTYIQQRLAVSDSEGAVQVWDTVNSTDILAFEEHTDRVWSVDCSPLNPNLILSASMDATARLWSTNDGRSVATIQEDSQVCSAAFCPTNANLLALGTASCFTKLYDVRKIDAPVCSAPMPRAVSYVRFMGDKIVSSVVDSTIQMHDVASMMAGKAQSTRELRGHLNMRNFVGMACTEGGYVFTGSETNEVVMYHDSLPAALARRELTAQDLLGMGHGQGSEKPIVSCVCAARFSDHVVAGGTTGWMNVFRLV